MSVPEGIKIDKNKNVVCKLNKSLYGLKQSANCWFQRFDKVLKHHNFKSTAGDRCLYFLDKGHITENINLILYVDDLIIVTGNMDTMSSFKNYLMKQFQMVGLKDIKYFLGIRIQRNENDISLDQSGYLQTVLKKFNMNECNPVNIPLQLKLNYKELNSDEYYEAPCRNLIG